MQFILDHQIRRRQRAAARERLALTRVAGAIEAVFVEPVNLAEERPCPAGPGQGRKLVHRGDQKGRQTGVERIVNRHDGQRIVACERAQVVGTVDAQVQRLATVGHEVE